MNNLFFAISNTVFAIIGIVMGILFIGIPCLVFLYLAGIWTSLSVYYFIKYAESRGTETITGKQSNA